jgi:mannose-6-phosphate isomerase-like protein (cupin superfamily)
MADYTIKQLEEVPDVLGDYPGEMRMFTGPLECEQVAFTHRRMPPDTGGKGSYGHSHPEPPVEEVYFVVSGTLTFKIGDDKFEAGPGTAIKVPGTSARSVHNETDEDVHLVIVSKRSEGDPEENTEFTQDFWPD